MINPQSLTLRTAYDPFLAMERCMFLDGSLDNPMLDYVPSANDETWVWAFEFDHAHTLIHVMIKNYVSLSEARQALYDLLWNHKKIVKCSCITDMIEESSYSEWSISIHDDIWGVNSNACEEGDVE